LSSDRFAARKQASDELIRLSDLASAACRKALAGQPPLEVRRRLEAILEKHAHDWHNPTGERLRTLRAIEVLETAGATEAGRVLETLAEGAPEARLTREARASVQRLKARFLK
jgi:hypothetical protein